MGRGGRGERADLELAEDGRALPDALIVGAEVMPPLADAVRLVDDDQRGMMLFEEVVELGGAEALGGEVEEFELPVGGGAHGGGLLRGCDGAVEAGGGEAVRVEGVDLILHEGDEGRDDERVAGTHHRGQLVAERLAGARRHDDAQLLAGQDAPDDLLLPLAERRVAEMAPQRLQDGRRLPRPAARRHRHHASSEKRASTKASRSKGCRSSALSPSPTKRTG